MGCANQVLNNFAVAEEITQETFYKAFDQWASDEVFPENPKAWLIKVAQNKAIDYQRRETKHRCWVELETEKNTEGSSSDVFNSEEHEVLTLFQLLCHPNLSFELQSALILSALGGLTNDAIALIIHQSRHY